MPREVCEACRFSAARRAAAIRPAPAPAPGVLRSLRACALPSPAELVLARRQQDLLALGFAGLDARDGHLLLCALLGDARHLRGEIGVVRRGLVVRALLLGGRLRR